MRCKFYVIERKTTGYYVDSSSVRMDAAGKQLSLDFTVPKIGTNEVKYFLETCIGSSCCPPDPRRSLTADISNDIAAFEATNQINVSEGVVTVVTGKEGEHCSYYPLEKLTGMQKITVIELLSGEKPLLPKIYLPIVRQGPDKNKTK